MVLPVVQSLLTLVLLVAAFGFMAWRLWRVFVLVNTGARADRSTREKITTIERFHSGSDLVSLDGRTESPPRTHLR